MATHPQHPHLMPPSNGQIPDLTYLYKSAPIPGAEQSKAPDRELRSRVVSSPDMRAIFQP